VVPSVPLRVRVRLTVKVLLVIPPAIVNPVTPAVRVSPLYVLPVKADAIRASATVPLEMLSPFSEVMLEPLPVKIADTVVAVITLAAKLPATSRATIVEELLALVAFVENSMLSVPEFPVIIIPLVAA
jgi:hypothetical protein